ncbi:MAG: hypothetical protein HQ515_22560 [Phycisphaeraceae bacterium]|nr:hypothetical protein [Phycisphaeraceae bacterium]
MLEPCALGIDRLNNGAPILSPTTNWWESGVTFNPAAIYIKKTPENQAVINNLLGQDNLDNPLAADGIAVIHYRARPKEDKSSRPFSPSFSGLAIFSPELELIKRYDTPIILPDEDEGHYDHIGVEDGRLNFFEGEYYYLYCGVSHSNAPNQTWSVKAQLCLAKSKDLIHWTKLGPLAGQVNTSGFNNKDGAFFPEKIDGKYFLLHRPCRGDNYSSYAIALAMSHSLTGDWTDLGIIKRAEPAPSIAQHVWVGAGSVPIRIDKNRYIVIYHRGHLLNSGDKWYDLHAALFNFNRFDPNKPGDIIEGRIERLLVPETEYELNSVSKDGVANVVFACGSYEYKDDIYIVYGAADCYTLAAKINKQELVDGLVNSDKLRFPKQ